VRDLEGAVKDEYTVKCTCVPYFPIARVRFTFDFSNRYLLKSVTYSNGTAEDLGLPKEELLPEGAPDRYSVSETIFKFTVLRNVFFLTTVFFFFF